MAEVIVFILQVKLSDIYTLDDKSVQVGGQQRIITI